MSNPTISFRLSEFHLAKALHIIRQLEPNYQITSISHIVKTCFHDYISKMNLNKSPDVPADITIELNNFLAGKSAKAPISFDSFINKHQTEQPTKQSSEKSTITSVSDFSPPEEWKDE